MYIMSKARSMYAGSSGSNYGVNKNSPGNGNGKWQGLWPSVGHARNARLINTRAGGDNRNVVFCMNQLGGVGKISNMFATTADGVQDCKNGCILPSNIKHALQQLTNYAGKRGLLLGLAGVKETVFSDLPNTSGLTAFDKNFSPEMQKYVDLINGLGLEFAVKDPKDIQRHVVVMLTKTDAEKLRVGGYGVPVLCDSILAYGFNCELYKLSGVVEDHSTDILRKTNIQTNEGPDINFTIPSALGGAQALKDRDGNSISKSRAIMGFEPIITIQVGKQPGGTKAKESDAHAFLNLDHEGSWQRAGLITNRITNEKYFCYMAPKSKDDGSDNDNFRNEMIIQGVSNNKQEPFTGWYLHMKKWSGPLESLPAGDYKFVFAYPTPIWNDTPSGRVSKNIRYYKMMDINVKIGNGHICQLF